MPFLNLPCDAPFMHGLDVESNSLLDPFSDSRPRLGPASQHSPFTMSVVRGQAGPSYHSIMEGKKPMESPGARILAGALHPPTTTSAKCCSKSGLSDGVQARCTRSLAISTIGSHTASQKNQHYSITSSARASTVAGMSMRSVHVYRAQLPYYF